MTNMNVPVEVLQNAPEILNYASNWFTGHVEAIPGDFIWDLGSRALVRYFFPKLAESDPKALLLRIQRLEDGAAGINAELHRLRAEQPYYDPEEERYEPVAQEFVINTMADIMDSPNAEKRNLLGRLIAQRLYLKTESAEELYLRQAEDMAKRMNERHLRTLATLYLVRNTPMPSGMTRPELYAWLDDKVMPMMERICDVDPSYEDLNYLTSLGVIHYDASDTSNALSVGSHAPAIEQNVMGVTSEHPDHFGQRAGRFYAEASELYEGKMGDSGVERISLAPYTLTPPGLTIAATVVRRYQTW
jgi:hypothetical protein